MLLQKSKNRFQPNNPFFKLENHQTAIFGHHYQQLFGVLNYTMV